MREAIQRGGKPCIKTETCCDFGPAGCAKVTLYDPCVSQEARARRRQAVERVCQELFRRGHLEGP